MTRRLRIVLVEPREGGNVGAVARAMKNFGLGELFIVGQCPPLHPVAEWWASGAEDLVSAARLVDTLPEALEDCALTIATTSLRGRTLEAALTPATVPAEAARLPDDVSVALVFGREDRGLTREEALVCHRTAAIPTNEAFPVMNLAQAVGVFAYAWATAAPRVSEQVRSDPAPAALLERLHLHAQALLLECGFLHANGPDRIYEELRMLAARAELTTRETELLLGMIRQVEWKLAQEKSG